MNSPVLHRGKVAKAPVVTGARELTRQDLLRLRQPRPPQNRPRVMREEHHRLARYVAAGFRTEEILNRSGYSYTRYSQIKASPAFQELVSMYREKVNERWLEEVDEFYETETSTMRRASRQLAEHLDDCDESGEKLPVKTLLAIIADRADRFGYSKKTIQRNENLNFAEMMEQIARASGRSNVIDAKPLRIAGEIAEGAAGADRNGGEDG